MHRRGKMAVEPAGCGGRRRCLRVGSVYSFFFSGSRYAPIRADSSRIGPNGSVSAETRRTGAEPPIQAEIIK